MGEVIHHRIRNKKSVYRVWSSVVDAYLTEEMTDKEITEHLKKRTVERALEEFNHEHTSRMERAERRGTSSFVEEAVKDPETAPWERERS